jgi:hypothetical protein
MSFYNKYAATPEKIPINLDDFYYTPLAPVGSVFLTPLYHDKKEKNYQVSHLTADLDQRELPVDGLTRSQPTR